MNFAVMLQSAARTFGGNTAISWIDKPVFSFAQLVRRAVALAAGLRAARLAPGDRVALVMSNSVYYYEALCGIWVAGLCAVPMNPRLHPREHAYAIENAGAKVCFTTPDLTDDVAAVLPPLCRAIEVGSPDHDALLQHGSMETEDAPSDAPAWLFYTSGTTGRPKGAVLTHRNLIAFTTSMLADSGAIVHDNVLHIAPLSHGSGFLGLAYLVRGRNNIILPQGPLGADTLAASLTAFGPLSFFAVPTVVCRLMDGLLPPSLVSHIKMIFFGGAPMYVGDLRRAIDYFGSSRLWHLYGQGEAPMTISYFPPWLRGNPNDAGYEAQLASVGIARTGVAVRVLDSEGRPAPSGVAGEIAVQGDVVMAGYWHDAEATRAALPDGWLHTGDIGRMDSKGFITLLDRSKDLIISGGSNIYPREIEEILLTHPNMRECAVVGIYDAQWGEVPIGFIVSRDGKMLDHGALDAMCLANLARYKRPKVYRQLAELPKSGYGKILKTELRTMWKMNP